MSTVNQKLKSMTLAGTITIPPRFPGLAEISFVFDECLMIEATENLSPKLQIKRTFFAKDVKAIFYHCDGNTPVDLEKGTWLVAGQVKTTAKKQIGQPAMKGILYVTENAPSQLEVHAGLTAAESAEYFPPLPDDRSVNHYAMSEDPVGCGPYPSGPISPGPMGPMGAVAAHPTAFHADLWPRRAPFVSCFQRQAAPNVSDMKQSVPSFSLGIPKGRLMTGPTIDVVILSRTRENLLPAVEAGIRSQRGVQLRVHRFVGSVRPDDANRLETIARARNEAAAKVKGRWLLFLDDDVQLASNCISQLHHALSLRPNHVAMAADYLGEANKGTGHVAMGATLFRKDALNKISFRWEKNKCECLCWCEDARNKGLQVSYLPSAKAKHLSGQTFDAHHSFGCDHQATESAPSSPSVNSSTSADPETIRNAKILVAFNRRDVNRFRNVFLKTLRTFGNHQEVTVVGYGLYPSECQRLSSSPGVRVISKAPNGEMPPVRRIADFGEITATYAPKTPVAYWDASDVLFQGRLDGLWQSTQVYPDKLLAVREPLGYPHNKAITGWTHSIKDPQMRDRAFKMFATNPFLNSGFGAGTAATMTKYFREATRVRNSPELHGTTDWGDQTALNMYCHTDKGRWQEVSQTWNYCVHDRPRGEVSVTPDGLVTCKSRPAITVVHGNAKSLPELALVAQS